MTDLLTALGLLCVLEGALYALFPEGMKGMAARLEEIPAGTLRLCGLFCAGFGFLLIAVLRYH